MTQKIISVFGSSAPQPGDPAYVQARKVGRLLAEAGFAVVTGGYGGTMSAASQGAAEASGHVIGVTSTQIEKFRSIGPNQWVQEEIRYDSLRDRLIHVVTENDGMLVLPGGIGTLSEMTLAWSLLQVGEIPKRPLVMLGPKWKAMLDAFHDPAYIFDRHLDLLHFADSPETAVDYVTSFYG